MREPMELAINWDPKNAKKILPGYAQPKYDGVPLTFVRQSADRIAAFTREGTEANSVPHLIEQAKHLIPVIGGSFTAEVLVPGQPFKYSSGLVRRKGVEEDCKHMELIGIIFDTNVMARPKETYFIRHKQFHNIYDVWAYAIKAQGCDPAFHAAPSVGVYSVEDVEAMFKQYNLKIKNLEGMMIHTFTKPWQPGKRCVGMSRLKPQPTIDLEVVGYEEAISKTGEGLGMVGRVNVRLVRKWASRKPPRGWTRLAGDEGLAECTVGVGPGKLLHNERKELWEKYVVCEYKLPATFAEIKYMPDPSYDALRQPTFQCFRPDKTVGDIYEP